MKKIESSNKVTRLLKLFYTKLFRINDTPQKIAQGFGLGVFLGIIPGTGPIAALALALMLRVNRASALLGSLLTNTWLSIATFILSIKVGSIVTKTDWQSLYKDWQMLWKNFHWQDLFRLSVLKIILPVLVGYFVVAFSAGLMVYLVFVIILNRTRHNIR